MSTKPTNKKKLNVIKNTTCFAVHDKLNLNCQKRSCSSWFNSSKNNNCVILCAKRNGPHKQEEIGKYFGLTRMRVCQILKEVVKKIDQDAKGSEVIQSLLSSEFDEL